MSAREGNRFRELLVGERDRFIRDNQSYLVVGRLKMRELVLSAIVLNEETLATTDFAA